MYNDSGIYPSNIFLEIIMKVSIYLVFVEIFAVISKKINEWKTRKANSQ
jgi:molybdopterin-containing oxidoreductase family membrane subunit